jgi:hypothetical protein
MSDSNFIPDLIAHLKSEGGFSLPVALANGDIQEALKLSPTSGYMVSLGDNDKWTVQLNAAHLSEALGIALSLMYSYFPAILASGMATRPLFLGAWIDTDTNELYLDWSEKFQSEDEAQIAAAARNQLAIWDVANMRESRTSRTSVVH